MMSNFAPHTSANSSTTSTQSLRDESDFIRDVARTRRGRAGHDDTEGRAAGLSVEIWPEHDVSLRVRTGHELRIFIEVRDDTPWARWERIDPGPLRSRPRTSQGSLGKLRLLGAEDLRVLMTQWLAWRTRD